MSHVIEKNARIWHHVGITWHVIMTPISSCPDMNQDWNKVPFLNWISPVEPFSSFRHQIIFQRDIQRTDRPNWKAEFREGSQNWFLKDTLAIPKSLKKSPDFPKSKSQISEIRFSVVHDVIGKYYVIVSVFKKTLISLFQKIMTLMFWFEWTCYRVSSLSIP